MWNGGRRARIHDAAACHLHALGDTACQDLLRGLSPERDEHSIRNRSKAGKKRQQAFQAGEIRRCQGNLERPPLNHGFGFQNQMPFAFTNHDPGAAGQQEPEIRAGEHAAAGVFVVGNPINVERPSTGPDPGTKNSSRSRLREQLTK